MKVLYITHFNPWKPKYGAAYRSFGLLRGINHRHDLHIALTSSDTTEAIPFIQNAPIGFNHCYLLNSMGSPGRGISTGSSLYAKLLRRSFLELEALVQPDVVWYFTKYVLRKVGFPKKTPVVLDLDDVPWRKMLLTARYQHGLKKVFTLSKVGPSWIEDHWLARRAQSIVITNPTENKLLRKGKKIMPVLNGFDFPKAIEISPRSSKKLLFFGSLFYYPNLEGVHWFCREVLPKIRIAVPEVEVDIAGLRKEQMKDMESIPGVRLLGFVEDLDPLIRDSACLIVPLRIGSGTRIKILEAWSKGLPVVTTTLGAEGLRVQDGEQALVGDSSQAFAEACIRLLLSPNLGTDLAHRAFEYGVSHFSWESIYPSLEHALEHAVHKEAR
jgi:glycosyltransferase involved in cell wall biosynthesis